jgi:hypothetical protein
MKLEELLRTKVTLNGVEITPQFRVSVQEIRPDFIHFIIHPQDYDGATLDFYVRGNNLTQLFEVRHEEQV